jgi:hypothetical protein
VECPMARCAQAIQKNCKHGIINPTLLQPRQVRQSRQQPRQPKHPQPLECPGQQRLQQQQADEPARTTDATRCSPNKGISSPSSPPLHQLPPSGLPPPSIR